MRSTPSGCGILDHVVAQIVAFTNTVGHVKVGCASAEFDGRFQNDDRHRAIDVVVAVNQDGFFTVDGRIDAVNSRAEASHFLGGMQVINRWNEKAGSVVRLSQTAADEQPRQRIEWAAWSCGIPRSIRNW